jgi:circadian clock protein KaiB
MRRPLGPPAEALLIDEAPAPDAPCYVLRLYITGSTPHSTRAISNIRKICEEHLHGRYELEVVDI